MEDADPIFGVVLSLLFLVTGAAAIWLPKLIQRRAQASRAEARLRQPFSGIADADMFVPALRIMGSVMGLVGLLLLIGSIVAVMQGQ